MSLIRGDFFADNNLKIGTCGSGHLSGAFDGVVVGYREAVDLPLSGQFRDGVNGEVAVVGIVRMDMEYGFERIHIYPCDNELNTFSGGS